MILFFFLKSQLNLKIKSAIHFSHSGIKKPLSEVAFQTRESLKRPCFPLPLSILAGSNLIMLLFFFCNHRLIPKKIHPHSISGKIHPRLISEKIHAKPPRKTKSIAIFFCSLCFLDQF